MPGLFASALLVLLACASGLELRGTRRAQPSEEGQEWQCGDLDKVPVLPARPLPAWNQTEKHIVAAPSFSCHVAAGAEGVDRVADGSMATCSPVCAEALDVVIVLGVSDWSLEQSDADGAREYAVSLLKHFELGRARGSLFGYLDVSRGARKPVRVSPLSGDRKALKAALQAWSPQLGGKAVTNADLQGFEERPEVLAMLDVSRPSVRRTLLVLQPPPKAPPSGAVKSHLGLLEVVDDPFKRDKEIMELLVSTCPAVRIDPTMPCGRMRWGNAEPRNSDKMQPWGDKSK